MKPGDRIVIDTLSAQLGISPIPLRAALQRLQAEGLVEITPHTGAVVFGSLAGQYRAGLVQVLERLELMGFELALPRGRRSRHRRTPRHLGSDGRCAGSAGDNERWSELNAEFHRTVALLSGNKLLAEFTDRALADWNRLRRWYLADVEMQLSQAQAEHRAMVDSLERRDLSGLQRLIYDHHQRIRRVAPSRAVAHLTPPGAGDGSSAS